MFTILCNSKVIFHNRGLLKLNFNGRRDSTETTITTLGFLHIRRRSLSTIVSATTDDTTTTTTTTTTTNKSFTVSYLINSWGLSEDKAISVSKKLRLKTSSQPDSVLTLLREYGFTDTHISNFALGRPILLMADPNKTLKPKFEFFNSIGLCGTELADILYRNTTILTRSLENHIIPTVDFLKSLVHTDTNLIKMLKRCTRLLDRDLQKHLVPNISLLRAHGVPDYNISALLIDQPRSLLPNVDRLEEVIKEVKEMGFDSSKVTFVFAIHVFVSMKKSVLERKFEVYRKWGWSEEEICTAFVKHPHCMRISENKISCTMNILVNKMGYDPSLIAQCPKVLNFSLENRIIPRCLVLQVLNTKGLLKKDYSISNVFGTTEKDFLKNFVTKFENKVPNLLNVYLVKVNALELPGWYVEVGS